MNTIIYNERLLKFAKFLQAMKTDATEGLFRMVHVYAYEEKVRIHVDVKTHYWIFEELIDCFPEEWSYHEETGEPFWDELGPDSNVAEGVVDFFGLQDYNAFCHLWDLDGHQDMEKFGGKKLTEDSDGEDIAFNIYEYVKRKAAQNG